MILETLVESNGNFAHWIRLYISSFERRNNTEKWKKILIGIWCSVCDEEWGDTEDISALCFDMGRECGLMLGDSDYIFALPWIRWANSVPHCKQFSYSSFHHTHTFSLNNKNERKSIVYINLYSNWYLHDDQ